MTNSEKIYFANNYGNEVKLLPYNNTFPKLHESVFTASGSKIIGDVEIAKDSSIWYNTVIRGDVNYIKIGERTNVQDCSMLHVTNKIYPLIIGNDVTIGHSVTLHGCILKDFCLIGMNAVVLDGAIIEEKSMVAAGSVVRPGYIVPTGKLAAGVPAKIIRDLSEDEMHEFERSSNRYIKYTETSIESLIEYLNNTDNK